MEDLIFISACHEEELAADGADLHLTVEGSSLVTGRAALEKAKEVQRLVEELSRAGIEEAKISLEGVRAELSSGLFSRSSSASYRLRVRCDDLALLPDVLGAVTSARNVRLEALVFSYPESVEKQAEWLRAAVADAQHKAAAAASALGTRLAGVHRFREQRTEAPPPAQRHEVGVDFEVRMKRAAPLQLGFDLTQKKRAGVTVTVEYRVG